MKSQVILTLPNFVHLFMHMAFNLFAMRETYSRFSIRLQSVMFLQLDILPFFYWRVTRMSILGLRLFSTCTNHLVEKLFFSSYETCLVLHFEVCSIFLCNSACNLDTFLTHIDTANFRARLGQYEGYIASLTRDSQ